MATTSAPADADRVIALIDGALADPVSPDAMRWRPSPAPATPAVEIPADIRIGDVVDYHGSIQAEHDECVVVAVDSHTGRLTLRNHHYPDTRLDRVRRTSVTPTGRWVPVCRCGHPHVHPGHGPTGTCPRIGCPCPHHP